MPAIWKNFIGVSGSVLVLFFLASPLHAETEILKRPAPREVIIKELYAPGIGLPVGKIQSVQGRAVVFHSDPSVGYRIEPGLPLYKGDHLQTLQNGRIFTLLIDGSKIAMAPESGLVILQCNHNAATKSGQSFLSLTTGAASFHVKMLAEAYSREVKVETETAFIVAKRADFIVRTNGAATLIAALADSRLDVTGMAAPEEVIALSDYQQIVLSPESHSAAVETLSPQEAESMATEFRPAVPGRRVANLLGQNHSEGPGNDSVVRMQDSGEPANETAAETPISKGKRP